MTELLPFLEEGIGYLHHAVAWAHEGDGGASAHYQAQLTLLVRQLVRIVHICYTRWERKMRFAGGFRIHGTHAAIEQL